MKKPLLKTCFIASAISLCAINGAWAQDDEPKATSLDQLLQMVKEDRIRESREHQQREAEFRQQKANQQKLLDQAKQTKAAEERRSEQLEQTYNRQEIEVAEKRRQRQERLGSLNELFGHLTSAAGDLRANLDTSIVSAQPGLADRDKFLSDLIAKMNSAISLPSIDEIEQLWYEMQREATEDGKIVSFTANVVEPSGETVQKTVVRIGNFNLISDDGLYLRVASDGSIATLPRQPEGLAGSARDLAAATSGFVRVGVDPTGPTGGSFLAAIINTPSLIERWHQGLTVGYVITGLGVFALFLALFRILALSAVSGKVSAQLKSKKANPNNPLGRVLQVAEDNPGVDGETLELKLEEAILKERPKIESGITLLRIIYMVAPLLGLLGTVTGMIVTFQAITIYGAGDPKPMASGISAALITTVLGLYVAIPTMLLHTWVNSRAKRILHILEEQSAGIIAQNAER